MVYIVVFIPHIQYPDLNLLCLNKNERHDSCSGPYRPEGFVKQDDGSCYRRVYDMDRTLYFIPYMYKCTSCNSKKTSAVMLEESQRSVTHPYIPIEIQIQIGIHFAAKSAVTYASRDHITNSAMSSATFYQTRINIHSLYLARYMRTKYIYESRVRQFKSYLKQSIAHSFSSTSSDDSQI